MQTRLNATRLDSDTASQAEAILRSCVHCGFCNATCPTYQLQGDELDGPRGRIYLIKEMLEGGPAGETTRRHLDRCLTCLSCETTCPSGVQYGQLLEIGREHVERHARRPWKERLLRRLLRSVLPHPWRVRFGMRAARPLRRWLPEALVAAMPRPSDATPADVAWPPPRHARRVLVLSGCVQAATHPQINAAAARLLDRHGVSLIQVQGDACCGAVCHHLAAPHDAAVSMRRNIRAWWPWIEQGAEAVIATSSACTAMLRDYGRLLAHDPEYRDRAQRVSACVTDLSALVASLPLRVGTSTASHANGTGRIAFHAPCTLQHGGHGRKSHLQTQDLLQANGAKLTPVRDSHLCCGAAGTYAVLQPELSQRLLKNKLAALQEGAPGTIVTANIGCQIHLQSETRTPVKHWIEWLEEADRAQADTAEHDA